MDNFTNITKSQNGDNAFVAKNGGEWYVCRYRTLTQEILELDTLEKSNLKIYLPVVKKHTNDTKQNCRNSRPVVPGFIFVKGKIEDIRNDYDLCRYRIMYTKTDFARPITIRDSEMEEFISITSILAQAPDLIYSDEFDQSAHNIAEYVEEDVIKYAYIETLQGVNGGNLIVPVRQDEIAGAIYRNQDLNDFKLPPRALCYKLPAADIRFAIRHIAHENTYDLDYVNNANKRASIALQRYAKGEAIDEKTKMQLGEYLYRYRIAQTDKFKLRSKICLLIYKCSTILQAKEDIQLIKERIVTDILPEFEQYVKSVRKDKRPARKKNFDKFKQSFEKVRTVEENSPSTE